jgi:antirestriction protein ArdC
MGSAFLCGYAGIAPVTLANAASYLAGWLKALRGDSRLVVQAAASAQKAADLILGPLLSAEPPLEWKQLDHDCDDQAEYVDDARRVCAICSLDEASRR